MKEASAINTNSLMIGDDYHADINGAIQSGMQAVLFDPLENQNVSYEYSVKNLSEIPSMAISMLR
jgi:FMN phosphatase YigB (HAD superfamily)